MIKATSHMKGISTSLLTDIIAAVRIMQLSGEKAQYLQSIHAPSLVLQYTHVWAKKGEKVFLEYMKLMDIPSAFGVLVRESDQLAHVLRRTRKRLPSVGFKQVQNKNQRQGTFRNPQRARDMRPLPISGSFHGPMSHRTENAFRTGCLPEAPFTEPFFIRNSAD